MTAFHLKSTVGRSHRVDLDDALRAKQALHELGYFKTPRWGLTQYPDEALFAAIEDFQRDQGLARDGIMRPDGETAARLGAALAELQHRYADSVTDAAPPAQPHGRAAQILTAPAGDEQVAQASPHALGIPNLGGPAGSVVGMGLGLEVMRDLLRRPRPEDTLDYHPPSSGDSDAPPAGPPPAEPPENEPGSKRKIPTFRGKPINEVLRTDPAVFEIVSDELRKSIESGLESHRGDDITEEGNRRIAELCKDEFKKGWSPENTFEHVAGARKKNPKTGAYDYLPEKYLPNRETGGRLGSSNPDITFEMKRPSDTEPHYLHANSGKTLKDGRTPIASERRQLERLARNVNDEDLPGFFPKLRPGMDEEEWEERVRAKCRELITDYFGEPQRETESKKGGRR